MIYTLVLRMPTQLNEVFIVRLVEEAQNRLRTSLTNNHRSRAFAQKIDHNEYGRLEIKSEDKGERTIIKRDPDAAFPHDDSLWPGAVMEVSYSQSPKDIRQLTGDYILETNGCIRIVVGLDIDYKKKSTISIWRPNYLTNDQGQLEVEVAETSSAQVYIHVTSLKCYAAC